MGLDMFKRRAKQDADGPSHVPSTGKSEEDAIKKAQENLGFVK